MRMIKMTRNITRFKITSDLQIKHELASNRKRLACVAGGIRGHERMGSLKYRLPKNDTF